MARPTRRRRVSSSSTHSDEDCSSDSSCKMSVTTVETHSPSPEPMKRSKRKRRATDDDEHSNIKSSKRPRSHKKDNKKRNTPREQCLHFARWIPRGIDMFCILKDVFRIAPLIESARRSHSDNESDTEGKCRDRDAQLANISKDVQDQLLRTYKKILTGAPYLHELVKGGRKKSKELMDILDEMQYWIGQVRSGDSMTLKKSIARYATYNPSAKGLEPPIFPDSKESRAKMGLNHPELARMLCPVKYLKKYQESPSQIKAKLESGDIKMDANSWPALLYRGHVAGEAFDPKNIQDGLFEGFLLERVIKHILIGPSSALAGDDFHVSNSCNASLHGMMSVEAESIAYGAVQARSAISSRDKWCTDDGNFSYRKFYYRIINLIRNPPDEAWAIALLQSYNLKLFKDKAGRAGALSTSATSEGGTGNDDEGDDIVLMRKQFAIRSSNVQSRPTSTSCPPQSSLPSASSSASPAPPNPPRKAVPARKAAPAHKMPPPPSGTLLRTPTPPPAPTPLPEAPTTVQQSPIRKKAKPVVFKSPLTAEESEEEVEQMMREVKSAAASKAKTTTPKNRKGME